MSDRRGKFEHPYTFSAVSGAVNRIRGPLSQMQVDETGALVIENLSHNKKTIYLDDEVFVPLNQLIAYLGMENAADVEVTFDNPQSWRIRSVELTNNANNSARTKFIELFRTTDALGEDPANIKIERPKIFTMARLLSAHEQDKPAFLRKALTEERNDIPRE